MALQALMKISGAEGESKVTGFDADAKGGAWIEIQGWDWEVECESSWTKGGGASVGKPNPGKMNWEHYYDTSSPNLLFQMIGGTAFPHAWLIMMKSTGIAAGSGKTTGQKIFFKMHMEGVFITKVSNSATDEGNVLQKVEMVFKNVEISYKKQNDADGSLGAEKNIRWEIPTGKLELGYKGGGAEEPVDPK